MRNSNRRKILQAVIDIIEREGVTAVTFDAVAAETGLTRGGLLYHFPSREALMLATHQYAAQLWEAEMAALAEGNKQQAPHLARYTAYVQNSADVARRVDLLLLLESVHDAELEAVWRAVCDQWAPSVPNHDDSAGIARFIARLAAEGLWLHEALSSQPMPARLRARISRELMNMIEADD